MISIIGVTGRVGGSAASRLLEMNKPVRAVVRDEAKGQVWASKGASVAVADMTDGDGLRRAIAGSEAVFVMLPPLFDPSPGFPEAKGLIDSLSAALRQSEAKRIVALSTIGAHVTRPNLLNALHMMEESFRQLPMPVTFLRPGWFMENHAGDVGSAMSAGIIQSYLQPIEHALPMIATKDIGALAGTLLLESWSGKRVVELEAKTRVSSADIAATLTDILGKPVKAEPVPRARWEEVFRAQGMKNPTPRIQMIEGFNEGWIEFEGGFEGSIKGQTPLKTVLEEMVRDARKQAA
ncbi:MAG TPA: NAD(P)H-binding protein [Candidatus Acidoferrales bacterium]|nr:NAD(P)H-binding protein [Candidatus Acidoferrales bacterium]